jgi:hypothetical protein
MVGGGSSSYEARVGGVEIDKLVDAIVSRFLCEKKEKLVVEDFVWGR